MKKFIICVVALFVILATVCICVGASFEYQRIDNVYINEVLQGLDSGQEPEQKIYDYTVFDKDGLVLFSTIATQDMSYDARISKAVGNGDIVMDYKDCKVVFYIGSQQRFDNMRDVILVFVGVSFGVMAVAVALCVYLLFKRTVKPFEKLKAFSGEVAKGNLDFPLILDKYNSFGAFGEAFDIMRNNLKESRLAEQKSVVDKRRLMQEIGHEIKTPLASIRAIAECGCAVDSNEDFAVILDKANTIDNLVNDFYHATLEEEGQLNIYLTRHSSKEFAQMIASCDYNGRARINTPPDCFVLYDKIRMAQVIDNIIANSYKYADTDISVEMTERDGKLIATIRDSGSGVPPEQLSFVMDRFYRGEKTAEKLGQGLGLHICRKLVDRMGGEMTCRNDNGFVVEIA
ncbi:MAG: HAMP domain-containing histidine kinase, partial [Clostridia bacterium]|nr:HAMP domain-containing histidine kinase [Clostridia bacterium]